MLPTRPIPLLVPQRTPSPTSAEDNVDYRSENLYSAVVVAHGAAATVSMFLGAKGQAIPEAKGGTITATTSAHQMIYSDQTTNVVQNGQMGSTIGEVSITGLGLTVEQGGFSAAGVLQSYGAGPVEFPEIVFKTSFEMKIGSKTQIKGPTFLFPGLGGLHGAIASTGNNTTVAYLANGLPGQGRDLDFPLPLARTDTLEGVYGVTAPNSSLVFSLASGVGQPCLVWCGLRVITAADVR